MFLRLVVSIFFVTLAACKPNDSQSPVAAQVSPSPTPAPGPENPVALSPDGKSTTSRVLNNENPQLNVKGLNSQKYLFFAAKASGDAKQAQLRILVNGKEVATLQVGRDSSEQVVCIRSMF